MLTKASVNALQRLRCLIWFHSQGSCSWNGNPHSCPVPRSERWVRLPFFTSNNLNESIIFREINVFVFLPPADDFQSRLSAPLAGGLDAVLSGEDEDDFFDLQIVKHFDPEVSGPPLPLSSV